MKFLLLVQSQRYKIVLRKKHCKNAVEMVAKRIGQVNVSSLEEEHIA